VLQVVFQQGEQAHNAAQLLAVLLGLLLIAQNSLQDLVTRQTDQREDSQRQHHL